MYAQEITFVDLDGKEVKETFHFNLTKAELIEMNFEKRGGLQEYFAQIVKEEDSLKILKIFKRIVQRAVGKRSGNHFIKSKEITRDFTATAAYSEFLIWLLENADGAAKFMNGIIPVDMSETPTAEGREYSDDELLAMTDEDFKLIGGKKKSKTPAQLRLATRRKILQMEAAEAEAA